MKENDFEQRANDLIQIARTLFHRAAKSFQGPDNLSQVEINCANPIQSSRFAILDWL
jgi:hypothetical protein